MNLKTKKLLSKRLLVTAVSTLALAACAPLGGKEKVQPDTSTIESDLPTSERVAILNTAWGTPKEYSKHYRNGLADRAYRGPKQWTKDEACTDMYVGEWPYRVKQGLIPYAVAYRTPGMEALFDGLGVYRKDDVRKMYTNVLVPKMQLTYREVEKGVKKGSFKVKPASSLKLPIERLDLGDRKSVV